MPYLKRRALGFLLLTIAAIFVMFVVMILLMTGQARAETTLPPGVTCEQVKSLVAEHGKIRALAWAVRNGYSWEEIKEAKKCLKH